ncbi:InlB B-repeat-containing protein [Paenibacillus sp. YIM B09110]|uniref:InlB B-repeat-containing protein n=1 Tax=Paenibacillus sp. YIM B09110 TaxID=3126102 RepID=UPI00301C6FF0
MKKATKWKGKLTSQILAWMLVISMVATLLPVQQAAASELPMQQATAPEQSGFQDVSPTDWFYEAANYVQKNGIFSGTGGGYFSPKGTLTRAMYVTALGRMAGVDVSEYTTTSFADVQTGTWYAPYVEWAAKKGITAGTGNRKFDPNANVSREQMAAMTLRYFEIYQIPYQTSNRVTTKPGDLADVSPWAADAVVKVWQAGLFTGDGKGNFNPHAQASRAEAAVLFMRNSAVVQAWANQNPATETPNPEPGSNSGGNNGGNSNNSEYIITFESNGGTAIAARSVKKGEPLNKLPAPVKEGYIFQGWFRDSDFSLIFANGSTVSADTKLYAKYMDNVSNAVQSVPSYSVLDVAPDFTIAVYDETGSLTASEVQAGMTFHDIADPDSAAITVTGSNGRFTVASAAEDGQFEEGNTYQLTLTDENLSFQGQDETTSIYVFSVAKQEAMSVPLNPSMIYLRFADVTDMMLDGADVGSPAIPVVSTTVGDSETGLAAANASGGTFTYSGDTAIQVGDAVAIYEGVRPDQRTVETTDIDNGDVAYVRITAINGNTYTYGNADSKQVLFKPDVLPVSVEADTDGDPYNHSIRVESIAMNYSDSLYAQFGLSELTTVDVGDFIGFYEGNFAEEGSRVSGYGRITSVTPAAEMLVITYTDATMADIENVFDIYQQQTFDGNLLLSDEDIAKLEDQIERQAIDSGFVDQAANYLSALAMQTKEFKAQPQTMDLARSSDEGKVKVENLTVVASLGTTLRHIDGRTSGVSAALQVGADIVISIHEESDLVIHMTGTFLEEMSLGLGVDGDLQGHWEYFWGIPYWYTIDDYVVTANLDAYTYTGINVTAKIATVEHDKLQDALDDWDKAATGGKLGKVRDIATEIKALIDGVQDTGVDDASLMAQYQEMMENETDWVPLIKKELVDKSMRVALGIIEVNFTAEFVVNANVNLTIGADFNYTTAKRYSATLRVLSFTGKSDTVSLPGDGNYQFTFYVMGTLGLRAGIHMELKAGIGSVKLNSIGLAVEPGAYVNLWGYFYYQLKKQNGVQTSRSLGALYVEIGIYLESSVGAQLGDGLLSASMPVYDNTWPLYTVGEQQHVVDFAYSQDKAPAVNLAGSASSISVPQTLLTMSTFDLKTGQMGIQAYDRSRFDIQVDNRNFRYQANTGKIEVVNKNIQVSEGNLVITWKGAPLSYSSDSLTRKIPLNWLARVGDYIFQLNPQNGGMTKVVAAPYNAAISLETPVYQGYTFDGWYWSESGGTKVTIPSRMPASDWILYAHWIPNTDTPYTVQHYMIDPNTKTSTTTSPVVTETLTGTTGTEIRINSDRFRDQGYATGTASGVKIKGDGSSVVRVDYYPMNRTMTFDWAYAGAPGSSVTEAVGKNIAARIPVPTRPGYTFAGWSPAVPSAITASDTTYTAQWTAKEDTSYQVVYLLQNIGSDTYTVADTESYRGTTDTEAKLTNPTKSYAGFTFDGSVPGTVTAAPIAGKGTTVLKLYYKRNNYAMTINYNGSGEETKIVNVPFGATTGLYLGAPTWQGHAFTGWSPASPTTMPAQAVEFTAQWTVNTHTVSFNSNGGSAVVDQTVGYGFLVSQPDEPTKDNLVFAGWYSDSALTSAYDFATQVTADLALYAKWVRSYTVSFDSNEGSEVADQKVNEGDKASAPSTPTKEGFVFSGWYSDSELTSAYDFETKTVTANLTLYAKWTIAPKNNYTVSFNSNGGTAVADLTVVEGAVAEAPSAPTLIGRTFEGWYSDSNLTSRFSFSTTPITASLTLYAKWTINSYTVSFNSNGGSAVNNQTVVYDGNATSPTAPTRNGYAFGGWYSDAGLTAAYNFSTQVRSNFTLYAKWTAVYTVSFNSNGGSSVADQRVENGGKAAAPIAPTKGGYTFGGWYSDAALSEAYIFTERQVIANLTLYAKWTFNSYTVSFDSNNGPAVEDQAVIPGGKAVAPAAPKWVGYRFDGWYSDPELTNVYNFSAVVTKDITLYAKWTMTSWLHLGDTMEVGVTKQSNVVVDSQGTAYVAYALSSKEVFVKKYVEADDEWQAVGDPATLGNSWGSVEITLAMDSQDRLYVAYVDSTKKTIVKRYMDGNWEDVGNLQQQFGDDISIAFDEDDTPYIAYIDVSQSNVQTVYVKRFNGDVWENIDSKVTLGAKNVALAIDQSNTPYLFYTYYTIGNPIRAAVVNYVGENHASNSLSNPPEPGGYNMASFELDPNGVPYMTYTSGSKVYVVKYENNAWVAVGTAGFPVTAYGPSDIAFDSQGTPYVAYIDSALGDSVTLMKYENMSWSVVEYAGISVRNKYTNFVKLNIDSNDNIYVNFIVNTSNITLDGKETVMKYDPDLH